MKEMFTQKEVWNIEPSELQVYKLPDGSDWLLGTGSFGQVSRPSPHPLAAFAANAQASITFGCLRAETYHA